MKVFDGQDEQVVNSKSIYNISKVKVEVFLYIQVDVNLNDNYVYLGVDGIVKIYYKV